MLDRLRRTWRRACGDAPEPSAVVIDSRSCRSAPSCFGRGIDGGKKIRGIKISVAVDKYGSPLAIDVSPANRHDMKAIVPILRALADGGFRGPAIRDLGYRGERLAKAGETLGITVEAIARGRDGQFVPNGRTQALTLARRTKPTSSICRSRLRRHEFCRGYGAVSPVGLRPSCETAP